MITPDHPGHYSPGVALTRFDMVGRLDGVRRTPQGGIRATANLTRVGVFTYYNADGSTTRELRHPDDVFKSDALESLKGAPLTVGHPGMVTAENWRDLSVGHVGDDVRADGRFVKATVFIQDAETCAAVERGELIELSCGYSVDLVKEDGEFDGEKYDSRQVGHQYNHVAMGGKDWGRAGNDVRLHLDSAGNSYAPAMTVRTDDTADVKVRLDAAEKEIEKVRGERDALRADLERSRADAAQLKTDLEAERAASAQKYDRSSICELVRSRVSLETRARKLCGAESKFDDKSDRDIIVEALAKHDSTFKADGRSDEYLRARFDAAVEHATKSDAAVAQLNQATTNAATVAPQKTRLDEALERAAKDAAEAAKAGPPAGALTRS